MAEYIEREALIKRLKSAGAISDWGLYLIRDEPAADVRPERHGHWISRHDMHGISYLCSNCGCGKSDTDTEHYCHYCGARMDGGDGDN